MDSLSFENAVFTSHPNLSIASRTLIGKYPTEITFVFNEVLVPGQIYTYSINDCSDCSGNRNSYAGTFVLPQTRVKGDLRSEEHTSELQSRPHRVCRLLLEKK